MASRFVPMARVPHPSGRPVRAPEKRSWAHFGGPEQGYRTPRLNEPRIRQATDIFAVGFVDHNILEAQSEFE